ncbi:hypothetical protein HDV00_010504 [Rhizophlyctis rosea]|nr:hypothetical protein HDV00_010504 [Rhizophlyctis rosea]
MVHILSITQQQHTYTQPSNPTPQQWTQPSPPPSSETFSPTILQTLTPWLTDPPTSTRALRHLPHTCAHCKSTTPTPHLICTGCSLVRYCCRDHQGAHWRAHKGDCEAVQREELGYLEERRRVIGEMEVEVGGLVELVVRGLGLESSNGGGGGDGDGDGDAVTAEREERELRGPLELRARSESRELRELRELRERSPARCIPTSIPLRLTFLTTFLTLFKTRDAIHLTLTQLLYILTHLDPHDTHRIRTHIPFLLLRLNKDQKCYDFLKWYALKAPTWEWRDANGNTDSTQFLTIHDADVFEGLQPFRDVKEVWILVALMLVKLRIWFDLNYQNNVLVEGVEKELRAWNRYNPNTGRKNHPTLLPPTTDPTCSLTSPDPPNLYSSILSTSPHPTFPIPIKALKAQVHTLFDHINFVNPHMWSVLSKPEEHLGAEIGEGQPGLGSLEEARECLVRCYDAWNETFGAVGWIEWMSKGGEDGEWTPISGS